MNDGDEVEVNDNTEEGERRTPPCWIILQKRILDMLSESDTGIDLRLLRQRFLDLGCTECEFSVAFMDLLLSDAVGVLPNPPRV